jgi:hypothetical protein
MESGMEAQELLNLMPYATVSAFMMAGRNQRSNKWSREPLFAIGPALNRAGRGARPRHVGAESEL